MIPVSELVGAELDYWAARSDGIPADHLEIRPVQRPDPGTPETICVRKLPHRDPIIGPDEVRMQPSTCWAQGGPLIEKHRIEISAPTESGTFSDVWIANTEWGRPVGWPGPTPLIAVTRALVALMFGESVSVGYDYEVPK